MQIVNPATGTVLTEKPEVLPDELPSRLERARVSQRQWQARPFAERHQILTAFKQRIAEARDTLARTLSLEVGKPIAQSRAELNAFGERLEFFLENGEQALQPIEVCREPGLVERIVPEPLGVIANISAWNYPYFVGGNVFVPALLTGSAVLYKPSELATLTGLAIEEHLVASGVPASCFQALPGGPALGQALVDSRIDGMFFTGSYETGRKIAASLAPRMVPIGLELGGKDPAYVMASADIQRAAAVIADGAFYNAGQSCCAVERVYVHERVYDAFLEAFIAEVGRLSLGDPLDETTTLGPLARGEAQLLHLEAQIADALQRGAKLHTGGRRAERPGFFFEPSVLTQVDHTMLLMRQESFGPVIGIMPVDSDAQALRLMGDTDYGLTASVFCQTTEEATPLLTSLQVGSAYVNCCDRVSPRLPWSGRGHSGIGVTLSRRGIEAFLRPKAWHIK